MRKEAGAACFLQNAPRRRPLLEPAGTGPLPGHSGAFCRGSTTAGPAPRSPAPSLASPPGRAPSAPSQRDHRSLSRPGRSPSRARAGPARSGEAHRVAPLQLALLVAKGGDVHLHGRPATARRSAALRPAGIRRTPPPPRPSPGST